MKDRILRRKAVKDRTGLSDTQLDRLEHRGDFPSRRKISTRIVGWSEAEVQNWIQQKLHGSAA